MILNFVLVWNSCAKTEIINVSVSLIRTINFYCQRTEAYIMVVLWSLWQYFISGITVYHAGIGGVKSPSCAGWWSYLDSVVILLGGGRYCSDIWTTHIGTTVITWHMHGLNRLLFLRLVYQVCVYYRCSFRKWVMLIRNILSAEYEAKKSAAGGAQEKTTDSESDFPNRRRTQILAGLFATAAMTSYALSTGLLQVDLYFVAFRMFCFYYLKMFLYFLVI